MRRVWMRFAAVGLLVGVGAVGLAAVALAAQPTRGALYKGNSRVCAQSIRQQCIFVFRVSSDGRTLRFARKGQAVDGWACRGGGGEAVFNSTGKYAYTIPTARISSGGTFSGSSGHGAQKLDMTGRFTGSGATATLSFALPGPAHCHTPRLSLTKQ